MVKQVPDTQFDKYNSETRQRMILLIEAICQITKLRLTECIDTKHEEKWYESLQKLFEQAEISTSLMINSIKQNVQQSADYDKLQRKIEILNDIECRFAELQAFVEFQKYTRHEKELTELANMIQERLNEDTRKLNGLSIAGYHQLSQPSTLCQTLSRAIDAMDAMDEFKNLNTEELNLIRYYKQARKQIETEFYNVFKDECNGIMKVKNGLYQHSARVVRCRELLESLPNCGDGFKNKVEATFTPVQTQFNQMKQTEDCQIMDSFSHQIS